MIISDEQVRRAVEYLQTSEACVADSAPCIGADVIPTDLVDRVRALLADLPDLRHDRVEEGRALLLAQGYSSDQIAQKMIGRIISDSLR